MLSFQNKMLMVTVGIFGLANLMPARLLAQSDDQLQNQDSEGLKEIIVTANRRSTEQTNLLISVTAITEEDISSRKADSAADFIRSAPGIYFFPQSRGLNQITFDIDGLDPVFCRGTGAPEPDGRSMRDAELLIRRLSNAKANIIGGDVYEVASALDQAGHTALNSANLIFGILRCTARAGAGA